MERLQFKKTIAAPKDKVWSLLWNNQTYPLWTAPFCEGSTAETDWQEGSKVLFLAPNGEGLSSIIARKIDNEFMSFSHQGIVKDGIEDFSSEKVAEWAGGIENYTLVETSGFTDLTIDIDVTETHRGYFLETWPKALDALKALAEKE